MLDIRLLPRGAGKSLGCRNYLRDHPDAKFFLGDHYYPSQHALRRCLNASVQTNTIRGHMPPATFVLDELSCYSYSVQDYILTYSDRYSFIIYTSSETFSSDISPNMYSYVYARNPEYLL